MSDLDRYRPNWTRTEYGAFCPSCGERIEWIGTRFDWIAPCRKRLEREGDYV